MRSTFCKIAGAALILGMIIWIVSYLNRRPVDEREAEAIARAQVYRSGQQLRFDPALFEGPEPIKVGGARYAFLWRYADQYGKVQIVVSVDKYGGSEFAFDGDLERLRARR